MYLGDWLDTWLELYVDSSGLAESTIACYHRAVRAVPTDLKSHDLAKLTALDLMPWLVNVAKTTPRAAQLDRVMLCKALRVAYKLGLCPGCILSRHTPKAATQAKTGTNTDH